MIMEHLTEWLDAERGRRTALAAFLGVTPGALSQWRQVPADKVAAVADFTGIARGALRRDLADIFGQPEKGRAA